MNRKIKELLEFLRLALLGGWQGFVGILLIPFAVYILYHIVFADGGVLNLIHKLRAEERVSSEIEDKRARLNDLNMRINLIKNHSPDYIEELMIKHLNMADPNVKVLK
ncbi:MAG: hypothetical protein LBB23_01170 [Rickettsiales bacterium]|jgi:cell division protein FtsB|nr:hypothetical protein [Rickettsiales bacterium]